MNFINFTNHPSNKWSKEQIAAAKEIGDVYDIPFPNVDPEGDEDYIKLVANDYVKRILANKPSAVLCQGEMTLAFTVASILLAEHGIPVIAACSERIVTEVAEESGEIRKQSYYKFKKFREYLM